MKVGKLVLIADDLEQWRRLATILLETAGYTTQCVSNGEEALRYLEKHSNTTAVVVLDLNMPVMNGWEFLKSQRLNSKLAKIPVVIYSGEDQSAHHTIQGANVLEFVSKDDTIDDLVPTVKMVIERSKAIA